MTRQAYLVAATFTAGLMCGLAIESGLIKNLIELAKWY